MKKNISEYQTFGRRRFLYASSSLLEWSLAPIRSRQCAYRHIGNPRYRSIGAGLANSSGEHEFRREIFHYLRCLN